MVYISYLIRKQKVLKYSNLVFQQFHQGINLTFWNWSLKSISQFLFKLSQGKCFIFHYTYVLINESFNFKLLLQCIWFYSLVTFSYHMVDNFKGLYIHIVRYLDISLYWYFSYALASNYVYKVIVQFERGII